jgi:hypothetical protein
MQSRKLETFRFVSVNETYAGISFREDAQPAQAYIAASCEGRPKSSVPGTS